MGIARFTFDEFPVFGGPFDDFAAEGTMHLYIGQSVGDGAGSSSGEVGARIGLRNATYKCPICRSD